MTFEKELNETKNPWIKRIGNYLSSRDDIQENLKKKIKVLKNVLIMLLAKLQKKQLETITSDMLQVMTKNYMHLLFIIMMKMISR